jgi:hypothetical protein
MTYIWQWLGNSMQNWNWRQWLSREWLSRGVLAVQPNRRVLKVRSGWGIETEQLEQRALLSAANSSAALENPVADVSTVSRKATPTQFPTVGGVWNVTSTGEFSGSGTVTMTQKGAKVTSVVAIEGLETFTLVGRFKKKSPDELTAKSPRLAVPDFPIDVRLTITITFPSGNLNPTTFMGDVAVPFVGSVASLDGMKKQENITPSPDHVGIPKVASAPTVPDLAGSWTVTISNIPVLNSLTGPLTLAQHGRRITGTADLGSGTDFNVRARLNRKDPTLLSGRASVSNSQLGIKNAPFSVTLDNNNIHFAGSTTTKVGTLHLDGVELP